MKDLVEYAELVKARLVAEGKTCVVLWGRDASKNHDVKGPGTANRVVIYDGPRRRKGAMGSSYREPRQHEKQETRAVYRWQRVTFDVWAYNGAPGQQRLTAAKKTRRNFVQKTRSWTRSSAQRCAW